MTQTGEFLVYQTNSGKWRWEYFDYAQEHVIARSTGHFAEYEEMSKDITRMRNCYIANVVDKETR